VSLPSLPLKSSFFCCLQDIVRVLVDDAYFVDESLRLLLEVVGNVTIEVLIGLEMRGRLLIVTFHNASIKDNCEQYCSSHAPDKILVNVPPCLCLQAFLQEFAEIQITSKNVKLSVQAEPELLRPISASTRRSRERYKNCVS
jgi:hypothetical protein